MFDMGLKSRSGVNVRDDWRDQIHTYLGITISDYPNAFIIYSPQGKHPRRPRPSKSQPPLWRPQDTVTSHGSRPQH